MPSSWRDWTSRPATALQHGFGYQCHDRSKPHHYRQHGQAPIGWEAEDGPTTA
ncbi:hypothetical protein [Streptomyces anthocyanicus]|uniref:hypothetical protein n=1 Tax=Streptomyces anthocyanicus TaxID=68174 RepID=UPI00324B7980